MVELTIQRKKTVGAITEHKIYDNGKLMDFFISCAVASKYLHTNN